MTQDPNPYTTSMQTKATASKSRGRNWFIIASMIGFLGLLFTNQHYNTGKVAIPCPLWQYYVMESKNGFPSLIGTSLGGPKNPMVATMAIHLGLSFLLGMLVYGLRWFVLRRKKESIRP